ncbi:MAG: hypothetical protein ACK2UO_13265 [Caldilineaceae bacterium]|jgi:hypothetical protein
MHSSKDMATATIAAIGVAAGVALMGAYVFLETLRPKMVAFEPLTAGEKALLNYVGIGLMLALIFCILAVARIVRFSARTQRLLPLHVLVVAAGVLALLFIFSDIALLSDIGKQYELGLSQPEWTVLYGVMAFQVLAVVSLLYATTFTLGTSNAGMEVSRDSTIFLLAQVVGVLCGGVGLALTVTNFRFPRPLWMVQAQMVPIMVVILAPYALMAALWMLVKLREGGEWFDEKQRQDVGASAFLTMVIGMVGMAILYFLNQDDLQGMVSVLWFSFYAFLILLSFSSVNLVRSRDSLR